MLQTTTNRGSDRHSIQQPNARVRMTDTTGKAWTAVSNGFGYYRFAGLQIGQTYTFRVESRIGKFAPITVSLIDQLLSLDMVAGE